MKIQVPTIKIFSKKLKGHKLKSNIFQKKSALRTYQYLILIKYIFYKRI